MTPARLPESGSLDQHQGVHLRVTALAGASLHPMDGNGDGHRIFPFSCRFAVSNLGSAPMRLMSRHWKVCDEFHHLKELHGPCIPGQQPIIQPGANYTFPSTIGLPTEWGSFSGSLRFENQEGEIVDVPFDRILLVPGSVSVVESAELASSSHS